jgi:uncharacterized lipoprotein YehR (DUF1307 family)
MNKAEADKILKWSQDKYLLMKQRQRGLEVPFEYYDGYADALSHLDEYVEETTTDTDPRLEMLDELDELNILERKGTYTKYLSPSIGHKINQLRAKIKQEAEDE